MAQPSEREEQNDTVSTESPLPSLTFDLIAEILSRLPVKLLLQLRCLGKFWKSLISDPKFAKKHLQLSRHHVMVSSTNELQEFLLFDSPIESVLPTSMVTQTQLNYPIPRENDGYRRPLRMSSCDGILCFTINHTSAALWNPSIRKFKILPPFENPRRRVMFSSYSFGYDPFIDNYKVIGISVCTNRNEVSVNTLGTDNWRRIGDFPYSGFIHGSGVFVSGTVNWLAFDSPNSVAIVSLDLEKELYQNLGGAEGNFHNLGVLRDCLCIYMHSNMFFDVWVLKEYGNKESWTKFYSVPYMEDQGSFSYTKALYISEDDQILLDFCELGSNKLKLVVYDSKNGTFNIPEIQNINRLMEPVVYIESLISP